jgi:hypothetical protein
MEPCGLSRGEWLEKLVVMDRDLKKQRSTARLTLVGSAAGIFAGQPARTSIDLDVWKPTSAYQFQTLKRAVETAGLLFDPKTMLQPDKAYIQLVEPGLTQTGNFKNGELLEQFEALRLERPPIANLIAAKLVRAEAKDLEDIAFLLAHYRPQSNDIRTAVKSMPAQAREKARENLIYLDVFGKKRSDS